MPRQNSWKTERWKQFKIDLQMTSERGHGHAPVSVVFANNGLTKSDTWFNPVYTTPGPGSAIV